MAADSKPIVIVGGGVHGTALAMMLGRKLREEGSNQKVILVERQESPNTFGSSHGETRITRFANAEAGFLTKTAMASVREYRTLQEKFLFSSEAPYTQISEYLRTQYRDDTLFQKNGLLMMAPKGNFGRKAHNISNFIQNTIDNAKAAGIAHEVMDGKTATETFPGFKISNSDPEDTLAYFERESGTLFPERCVYTQLAMAQYYGVEYRPWTHLKRFKKTGGSIELTLGNTKNPEEDYVLDAHKVVLAAGAWIKDFMPDNMQHYFRIQRQVMGWFHVEKPKEMLAPSTPNFIIFQRTTDGDVNYNYGFAAQENGLYPGMVKTAFESGLHIRDPADALLIPWHEGELDSIFNFASGFIRGLKREDALGQSCRYTNEPDGRLIAAAYPEDEMSGEPGKYPHNPQPRLPLRPLHEDDKIIVVSACSGHGFKNALGLADAVASRMLGREGTYDIDLADYAWLAPMDKKLIANLERALKKPLQEKTAGKPGGLKPS